MFERYTERARRVLFFARYEASVYGAVSIETEHLLLGIVREGKGIVSSILRQSDVSAEQVRKEVERRVEFRQQTSTSVELPISDEAKRVLSGAAEEADRLGHSYIGVEHLLLGLLRDEGTLAGSILAAQGLRLAAVRDNVVAILNEGRQSVLSEKTQPALPEESQLAAEALGRFVARIDGIRDLVEQLGQAAAGGPEAKDLVDRINRELDALKPSPGAWVWLSSR